MNFKKQIPNFLTLLNLALGFLAIVFSFNQNFNLAATLILVAVVLDFLDGKIAKFFKLESELGVQLDSLADLVSFGVAPAVMMYALFQNSSLLVIAVLYVLASAFRLARFNTMKNEVEGYLGMPITVNGLIFPILYFVNASFNIVAVIFIISLV